MTLILEASNLLCNLGLVVMFNIYVGALDSFHKDVGKHFVAGKFSDNVDILQGALPYDFFNRTFWYAALLLSPYTITRMINVLIYNYDRINGVFTSKF